MQSVRKAHHVHRLYSNPSCLLNVCPFIIEVTHASSISALWLRADSKMLSCCYCQMWLGFHTSMKNSRLSWRWSSFPSMSTMHSAVPTSLDWKFRNSIVKRRLRNVSTKDYMALKQEQTFRVIQDGFRKATVLSSTQNDHLSSNHRIIHYLESLCFWKVKNYIPSIRVFR